MLTPHLKLTRPVATACLVLLALAITPAISQAASKKQLKQAEASIEKATEYLRSQQDENGAWTPKYGPAITGLVVSVLLDQPDIGPNDPQVKKGVQYILKHVNKDGSISAGPTYKNYNTAICLSALARLKGTDPEIDKALRLGEKYLRMTQHIGDKDPAGNVIDEKHSFRGGFGYGKHGRPDGSNTQLAVQALYDMGVGPDDPAMQEAVRFMSRLQGNYTNDLFADQIEPNGGAIYATSVNKDNIGKPESKADPDQIAQVEENGKITKKLTPYGSMTYAMMKTYIYANLERDDPRVIAGYNWLRNNFTVDHHPGFPEAMQMQSYFYYLMVMGKTLQAWDAPLIDPAGEEVDWRGKLIDKLVEKQAKDGSWANDVDRWSEGNPHLATCYALFALNNTLGHVHDPAKLREERKEDAKMQATQEQEDRENAFEPITAQDLGQ